MLTPSTRIRLQTIIERIARSEPVSLKERIYVQKFADRDPSVWGWLKKAQRAQQEGGEKTGLDRFLARSDPEVPLTPKMMISAIGSREPLHGYDEAKVMGTCT